MKSTLLSSISAAAWFAAIAAAQQPSYTVTDLGTLGGQTSIAFGINNAGRVGGTSTFDPGGLILHPFLWDRGQMIDAGALGPGLNATGSGPNGSDELAISAEISKNDPLNENFCAY